MEEVRIPAAAQAPPRAGEARVPISAFSPVGQLAFKGFASLNRIQSFVFETAYRTNENLLICAPTGAGKTNIAMMAILHCVEQHMARGVIQREEFKIVYVAPMKALAAEMTAGFGKRCASPLFFFFFWPGWRQLAAHGRDAYACAYLPRTGSPRLG